MNNQQYLEDEVLQKLRSFCAYRERARSEVKDKARKLGAPESKMDFLLEQMEVEGYLNEERFAEIFVRSKFNQNRWGKHKIKAALIEKRVPPALVEMALTELEELNYEETLSSMIDQKLAEGKSVEQLFQSMKVKGFEGELIYSLMQKRGLV